MPIVTIDDFPINVTVSEGGMQGPIGGQGPPGTGSAFSSVAGVTGFSITGSQSITGLVDLSGIGIISTILQDNTILISGDTSSLASSQNLTQTGINLISLINSSNAGVGAINEQSGILSFTGAGNVFVLTNGQSFIFSGAGDTGVSSNLAVTGSTLDNKINILSGNFPVGGIILDGQLLIGESSGNSFQQGNLYGMSGIQIVSGSGSLGISIDATFATKFGLQSTGSILDGKIDSLSGYSNSVFATSANLANTGQALYSFSSFISGNLISTGSSLVGSINSLSGQLNQSGSLLNGQITSLSGYVNSNFSAVKVTGGGVLLVANFTGLGNVTLRNSGSQIYVSGDTSNLATQASLNTVITNLGVTGSNLYNSFSSLSGNLIITGANLTSLINSISGQVVSSGANLYNLFSTLSGNLRTTGSVLSDKIISLSGYTNANLTTTGQTLYNFFSSLSGNLITTGANLSAIKITGSSILQNVNLTGKGNVSIFSTGDSFVFISGDVSTLATQASVSTVANNLGTTGSYLFGLINASSAGVSSINSLSGALSLTGAGNVSITITGQTITVSGNTGAYSSFATVTNLASTGTNLYNFISSVSGNLQTTGINLVNLINGLSGQLIQSGSNLYSSFATLSGNLINTGSVLDNKIIALSGYSAPITRPVVTGINVSGSNSFTGLISLTGTENIVITLITGQQGMTGNFIQFSGNTSVLATQSQITTLSSFFSNLSGNLNLSGASLDSRLVIQESLPKITGVSVTGGNSITGKINLTGIGGLQIVQIGNTLQFSGGGGTVDTSSFATITNLGITGSNLYNFASNISGNLITTGQNLQNQINSLNGSFIVYTTGNQTIGGQKSFSGNITYFDSYPSGVGFTGVSGLVYRTGVSGRFYTNALDNQISVDFYNRGLSGTWNSTNLNLNGNSVATANNLASTGSNLYSFFSSLSGNLSATGNSLQAQVNTLTTNLSNTGANLYSYSSAISGNLRTTGSTLDSKINAFSGHFQAGAIIQNGQLLIGESGSNSFQQGNLYGLSGIQIVSGSGTIGISIDANTLNFSKVTGISVTGGNSITGLISFIGGGTVSIFQSGNSVQISGLTISTGVTLPFAIGNERLISGTTNSNIIFSGGVFPAIPIVLGNIFNNSGNPVIYFNTSGITTSGFSLNFSSSLSTSNYYFHYVATTGQGYYPIPLSVSAGGGGGDTSALQSQINTINANPQLYCGSGSPEGVTIARSGSIYTDWYNQTSYNKITGTAAYGWI